MVVVGGAVLTRHCLDYYSCLSHFGAVVVVELLAEGMLPVAAVAVGERD